VIGESRIVREFVEHGRVEDCPVIDTHGHFGPYQAIYFPRWRPEHVLESMERCGVRWLIMSGHAALVDTSRGNRQIARVIAEHPDRFLGWWVVNPHYPERVENDLLRFDGLTGFVGFKIHPNQHGVPLNDDRYTPLFEYAHERKLPVLSHTWQGRGMSSFREVADVAERYPGMTLIMGHAGYGDWEESARVARDHERVYLELTAAYSVRGSLEIMIEHAGSRRILFGTDSPWFNPHYGIGCVLSAYMTDEDRRNILYRNAQDLFGLPID